jgi:magnesium-transporting ATPase (P-type)
MPIATGWNGLKIDHEEGVVRRAARRSGSHHRVNLRVLDYVSVEAGDLLLYLNSSQDGLHKLEAAVRRGAYGLNEVAHERAPRWYVQLIRSFHNPFIYLLTALAVVSFVSGDKKATVIVAVMVSISVGLRFIQEFRSSQAAARLRAMVATTATVIRPGPRVTATLPGAVEPIGRNVPRHPPTWEEVPIERLVPGDVIHLSAGDMVPADVILQNLLYDLSQTAIPFDRVDPEYLERPRRWQVGDIGRFMLSIGPISSIFDLTTFALLWFAFGANTVDRQSLFQTGWFVEGLLSQTLIIHMIRTSKVPFLQSRAATPLILLTLAVMAAGLAIPYTRLGAAVGMVPLPPAYFPWLAVTLAGYFVFTQVIKHQYLRRYGSWL